MEPAQSDRRLPAGGEAVVRLTEQRALIEHIMVRPCEQAIFGVAGCSVVDDITGSVRHGELPAPESLRVLQEPAEGPLQGALGLGHEAYLSRGCAHPLMGA